MTPYFLTSTLLFMANSDQPWQKFEDLFEIVLQKVFIAPKYYRNSLSFWKNKTKPTVRDECLKIFLNFATKRCSDANKIRAYKKR